MVTEDMISSFLLQLHDLPVTPCLSDPDNQIKIIKLMVFPTHSSEALETNSTMQLLFSQADQNTIIWRNETEHFVWVELQRRESRQSYGGEGEKVTEQARMVEV